MGRFQQSAPAQTDFRLICIGIDERVRSRGDFCLIAGDLAEGFADLGNGAAELAFDDTEQLLLLVTGDYVENAITAEPNFPSTVLEVSGYCLSHVGFHSEHL